MICDRVQVRDGADVAIDHVLFTFSKGIQAQRAGPKIADDQRPAQAPHTETERANSECRYEILHRFLPSVQRVVVTGATLIKAAFI